MFERYTEKARRVIFFARYEASELGSYAIDPEHILLGTLREDPDLFQRLSPGLTDAAATIRQALLASAPRSEKISISVDLPLSQAAKSALGLAASEAERLGHRHVGTAHLLLGLIMEGTSEAAHVLMERGLVADVVARHLPSDGGDITRQVSKAETAAVRLVTQLNALVEVLVRQGVFTREEFIEELAGRYILPDLHATLQSMLVLLIRKGVVNENERREIMGLSE